MDNQDAAIQPHLVDKATRTLGGETSRYRDSQESENNLSQQKEIFNEEAAFSFRKKLTPKKAKPLISGHPSPFLKADKQPTSASPQRPTTATPTISDPLNPTSSSQAQSLSSETGNKADDKDDASEWELVWKGSWIVPSLEPIKPSTSARKVPASLKKASLDNRQQAIFQGPDGVKLQSNVTELPGIVLAVSKPRQCQHDESSGSIPSEERQFMRENTEMHLVAKIRLSSFPLFLLMPRCSEPCRIFTSPESNASADFLKELFDHDDLNEMRGRCQVGDGTAIGQIALLLRVASKPAQSSKKKGLQSSVSKQDDNPFLQQTATRQGGASNLSKRTADRSEDPRRKFYQDTSMFLVYGMLADNKDDNINPAKDSTHNMKAPHRTLPTISFFAYPLVDHSSFSEQVLLNTRSLEQIKQDAEEAWLSDPLLLGDTVDGSHVLYEDPEVDSIMNGTDNEQVSTQLSNQTNFTYMELDDEDKTLHQEMEILRALERSKTWSPYTVLVPPNAPSSDSASTSSTKDIPKDRVLSRSHTLDGLAITNRDSNIRSSLSRHKSMDSHGRSRQFSTIDSKVSTKVDSLSNSNTGNTVSKASRKGISRMKSPSRAPQQPMDVATESLRRKLLGPGSVRGGLPSISSISSSSTTKSVEASNKATVKSLTVSVLSRINISRDHDDFKMCATNLYRSVTFAMRKDIASRRYNLEELERLMDRHAALL
ncbi:hypothetical protein BGX27_002926 [Mortierella sp. AM989]|nr:hypothetical protein BGX27_002926 [Mortierella sp. AM989]